MLFWPGVVGDFMKYLPITVIITLSSSLFVALLINPVFASKFMKLEHPGAEKPKTIFGKIIYPLNKATHFFVDTLLPKTLVIYEKFLTKAIGEERNPDQKVNKKNWFGLIGTLFLIVLIMMGVSIPQIPNLVVFAASVILGIVLLFVFTNPRLKLISSTILLLIIIILIYREFDHGVEFFPSIEPPRVYINVESPTGTNIEMSNKIAKRIEKKLLPYANVEIAEFLTNVGSSNNPFDGGSSTPNKSVITIQYIDYEDRSRSSLETTEEIRKALMDIPGAEIEIAKEEAGPPVGAAINIELTGDDFLLLGELSEKIRNEIKNIKGVVDLKDDFDSGRPEVKVEINRERASLFHANTTVIANAIRTAINGIEASKYRINEDEYDITVRLQENQRNDVESLKNLKISFQDKKGKVRSIPLSSVAEIETSTGPGAIRRKDLKRMVTISANAAEGSNANEVLAEVQAKLANFELPGDFKIDYTGQNEEQKKAEDFLGNAFMIAFLSIFLVMVIQFNSLSQPLIIMTAVGISLIGVFIGLITFAMPFGIIMTGIGIISLAGVVVNNNIVLIDYINILRKRGNSPREAAINAGIRRFRPVTLTAITTILGLIPLTFGFGFDLYSLTFQSGGTDAAFWRSMGVAVIFGLMFGTVLTLIIVPVIYVTIADLPKALKSSFTRNK